MRARTPSCWRRLRRSSRSQTSPPRSETHCAFRSPARRWRRSFHEAEGRRSSSNHRAFPSRGRRAIRVASRSPRPWTSSVAPGSRSNSRPSSSREGSPAAPASASSRKLVPPEFARRFHGVVQVHDAEHPDLVDLGEVGSVPLRVHPASRQDRPGGHGHRRRDGSERWACCAPRRLGPGGAARRRRLFAPRDGRFARLADCGRAGAGPRPSGSCDRGLADAQHAGPERPAPGLPVRPGGGEPHRPFPAHRRVQPASGDRRDTASYATCRATSRPLRSIQGRRLSRTQRRFCEPSNRRPPGSRPAGCDLRRSPAYDAPPSARGAEPRARRLPRARTCPATLARRVPARRGRHGDPAQPLHAPFSASDAAAVPRPLPGAVRRGARARGHGAGGGRLLDGHAGDRRLPRRTRVPPAPPVRRVGRLPAGARPAGPCARRGLPRLVGSPTPRARADSRGSVRRWKWPVAAPEASPASACCSRPRTSRCGCPTATSPVPGTGHGVSA